MKKEQPLVKEIRQTLEERNATLSPEVLNQLAAINSSLRSLDHTRGFGAHRLSKMLIAGLTGAVMILLLALLFYPSQDPITTSLDDLDILTTSESPDFYLDLEFYAWLEATQLEGENTSTR